MHIGLFSSLQTDDTKPNSYHLHAFLNNKQRYHFFWKYIQIVSYLFQNLREH